jgi:hypothetical protein
MLKKVELESTRRMLTANVIKLAKKFDMTPIELAADIGTTKANLFKVLNGNPRLSTLVLLAERFKVHVADLLKDNSSQNS